MQRTKVHTSCMADIPFGRRNRLHNGDFRVDQINVGAAVTPASTTYICDNSLFISTVASKITAQRVSSSLSSFPYSLKFTTIAAYTAAASEKTHLNMFIEGIDIADLLWGTPNAKPITISFVVKVSREGLYAFSICNNGETQSYVFTKTLTVGENIVIETIPGCTSGIWGTGNVPGLVLRFNFSSGTNFQTTTPNTWLSTNYLSTAACVHLTANIDDTYEISGVQIEAGVVATPFEFLPYQQALAWCQRYYQKSYPVDVIAGYTGSGNGACTNRSGYGTGWEYSLNYPVTMRATPTVTIYSPVTGAAGYIYQHEGTAANKAALISHGATTGFRCYANVDGAGLFASFQYVADARM